MLISANIPSYLETRKNQWVFFFSTTDLHNTKIKTKLNKHTAEPYLIFGDQIWETEKVKKKSCLQCFLAEIKHLNLKHLKSYFGFKTLIPFKDHIKKILLKNK